MAKAYKVLTCRFRRTGRVILLVPFYSLFLEVNSISKDKDIQVNHEIKAREVRLIGPDGKQLGIMPLKEALRHAQEAQLDLVKVASNAKPPVCKITDFGKYKYEQSKREKEARKNQKVINIKEIRMNPTIDEHDFQVRLKNTLKFLKEGNKVKVSIRFRGRQMTHTQLGEEVLNKMIELTQELGVVEKPPKMEGRNMVMVLSPKQTKTKE